MSLHKGGAVAWFSEQPRFWDDPAQAMVISTKIKSLLKDGGQLRTKDLSTIYLFYRNQTELFHAMSEKNTKQSNISTGEDEKRTADFWYWWHS